MVEEIESKSVMVSSAKRYGRTDKGETFESLGSRTSWPWLLSRFYSCVQPGRWSRDVREGVAVALAVRELDAVVCEDGVQLVVFTAK